MLVFVLIVAMLQLWLLTATMNGRLGGDDSVVWPAALASGAGLALNVGLLAYLKRLEGTRTAGGVTMASTLIAGQLFTLESLVTPTAQGIASRVIARTAAGNITLFAFDAGEELSEHTAPFDALVLTLSGALKLTIGGVEVKTAPETIVLMPANVPHAVSAVDASRMMLIMLRESPER
jgi:quercetin dioxygenase-like cupin family protein